MNKVLDIGFVAINFGHGFCLGLLREWCYPTEAIGFFCVLWFALTAIIKLGRGIYAKIAQRH